MRLTDMTGSLHVKNSIAKGQRDACGAVELERRASGVGAAAAVGTGVRLEEAAQASEILRSSPLPRVVVATLGHHEHLLVRGRSGRGVQRNHLGGGNDFVLREQSKRETRREEIR